MLAASQACSEVCDRLFHRKWRLVFVMQPVFPTSSTLCWQICLDDSSKLRLTSQSWLRTFSVPFMLRVGSDIWNVLLFEVIFISINVLILLKSWGDVMGITLVRASRLCSHPGRPGRSIFKTSSASQFLLCQWPLKPDEWWVKPVAL